MPELTKIQIGAIDKALQKIGIVYIDIRSELTDHIASMLEQKQGNFDYELGNYIKHNKKQLKWLNHKMFFAGTWKAYEKLRQTLLKPGFITSGLLLFTAAMFICTYIGQADTMHILFFIFCIIGSCATFLYLYRTFRFRRQFSGDVVYSFSILILLWLSIFILEWSESVNSIIVNLYYTFTVICAAAILVTFKSQYKYYKLKYS